MLVPLTGEHPCGEDLIRERDEEHAERCRDEVGDIGQRRRRQRQFRQAARDRADDRDTVILEAERPGDDDRSDDHNQRSRQDRHEATDNDQHRDRSHAHRDRLPAQTAELAHYLPQPVERLLRGDRQSEKLAELRDDEHDRDPVDVADQNRPGEVVREPAEPEQAGEQETAADEQREHRRQLNRVAAAGGGQRQQRGRDQCRNGTLWADDQQPGRSEQHVRDHRRE